MMKKINAIAQAKLIALLYGGASAAECMEETGLHRLTVNEYVRALRSEEICYIQRWSEDTLGRMSVAIHKLGEGKDAKRIPKSKKVRNQQLSARHKQAKLLGLIACSTPTNPEST